MSPFSVFDGDYYCQIDDVAMGSPLRSAFANAFLWHYEKQELSNCPPDFQPQIFRRYVDDIFVTFISQAEVKRFVNYMKKQQPNVKFTFKVEQKNTFSFLDIKICCENNKFNTSVHR